jgi:ubiquinol-cytochrome c reductase subunit 9
MFNAFYKTFMVSTRASSPFSFLFLLCRPFARNSATFSSSRLVSFLLLRVFHFPKESALRVKILLSRREDETFSSLTFIITPHYLSSRQSNTSVYVGVIIAGALVGEKMVNKGFDSMWESRNKGKLFKDLKLPDAEE